MNDWRLVTLSACIGSLFTLLPVPAFSEGTVRLDLTPSVLPESVSNRLSTEQLQQLAQSITVKIFSGDRNNGSGILIQRQGQEYSVVTNEHVLTLGTPYRIQTPDGRFHEATVARGFNFNGQDLAVLQFSANADYAVASLGNASSLNVGDDVFAAGFPFGANPDRRLGFVFTQGQITLLSDRAVNGGYQIGYTNDIQKGMSGGPVLNRQGQVVAINGMHAYPLWGDPYVFLDGTRPDAAIREIMTRSSLAIPIETFRQGGRGLSFPLETQTAKLNPFLPPVRLDSAPEGLDMGDLVPLDNFREENLPATPVSPGTQWSTEFGEVVPLDNWERGNSVRSQMPFHESESFPSHSISPTLEQSDLAPIEGNSQPGRLW
jgi:hypothetical protein